MAQPSGSILRWESLILNCWIRNPREMRWPCICLLLQLGNSLWISLTIKSNSGYKLHPFSQMCMRTHPLLNAWCTPTNCTVHPLQLQCIPPPIAGCTPYNCRVHPLQLQGTPSPDAGCTPYNCTVHPLQLQGAPPPNATPPPPNATRTPSKCNAHPLQIWHATPTKARDSLRLLDVHFWQ